MAFTNDQTTTQNFQFDNVTPNLTGGFTEDVTNNFVATGAGGIIGTGSQLFFGDNLDYGIYSNDDNQLNFTYNENNLLSFDSYGSVTFTSLNVVDSAVFTVKDIDDGDIFKINSSGSLEMKSAISLPSVTANGIVFYNQEFFVST